jgi:negative regulator of sigma E activity
MASGSLKKIAYKPKRGLQIEDESAMQHWIAQSAITGMRTNEKIKRVVGVPSFHFPVSQAVPFEGAYGLGLTHSVNTHRVVGSRFAKTGPLSIHMHIRKSTRVNEHFVAVKIQLDAKRISVPVACPPRTLRARVYGELLPR